MIGELFPFADTSFFEQFTIQFVKYFINIFEHFTDFY